MKTGLVHLDALLLGGVGFYGDPFSQKGGWDADNEIGHTCRRLEEFLKDNPESGCFRNQQVFYEIHIYGKETADKGYFEVFAGLEVRTAELPIALSTKYIPASDYIKLTLSGAEITADWWMRFEQEVLPLYGVMRNEGYIIQAYDDRFKGMDQLESSELDAYIPVIKA